MKIVEPSVEIITEENPLRRIELCGRVCYKSENKITPDSAREFVGRIIQRGHTSILEHARVKMNNTNSLLAPVSRFDIPYGFSLRCGEDGEMNARDYIALGGTMDELETLKNADDYLTARFVCDRAIANELVRHRVFSFSQESTRYVNYKDGVEFVRPLPFEWATHKTHTLTWGLWYDTCYNAERNYQRIVEECRCTSQEARAVLPLSTKTELVMTGTFDQWKAMLKLRTARGAHPQMRYLMELLVKTEAIQY